MNRALLSLLLAASAAFGGEKIVVDLRPRACTAVRPPSSLREGYAGRWRMPNSLFYLQKRPPTFRLQIVFGDETRQMPAWVAEGTWMRTLTCLGFYTHQGEVKDGLPVFRFTEKKSYADPATGRQVFEADLTVHWPGGADFPPGEFEITRLRFTDEHLAGTLLPTNVRFAVSAFAPDDPNDQANLHSSLALELNAPPRTPERQREILTHVDLALKAMPEDDRMLVIGGDVALALGDHKQAVAYYRRAIALWQERKAIVLLSGWDGLELGDDWTAFVKQAERRVQFVEALPAKEPQRP